MAAYGEPVNVAGAGEKSVVATGFSAGVGPAQMPVYLVYVAVSTAVSVVALGLWSMLRYQLYVACVSDRKVRPAKPNDGSRYALHVGWLLWQKYVLRLGSYTPLVMTPGPPALPLAGWYEVMGQPAGCACVW